MENRSVGFWMSPQQEHVWSLQDAARPGTFRVQASVLLDGPLDEKRLRTAVETVAARHDILRTAFIRQPGMTVPFQVIGEHAQIAWNRHDLSNLSQTAQQQQVPQLFDDLKHSSFDLQAE